MRERSPAALRFEPMAEKYLPEVLAIYNDYVVNTTVTFHIKPLTMDEMRTLVFHPDPRHATFVIILDGAVIGYVGLSVHHLREAYRDTADIAVYIKKRKPRCGNRGGGGTVYREVCKGARFSRADCRHQRGEHPQHRPVSPAGLFSVRPLQESGREVRAAAGRHRF